MTIKKSLMVAGAVATIGLAGATFGPGLASADTDESSNGNPMSSLVDKIASKFNLNETEVQTVFDEHKDEMQAEHKSRLEDRLSEAVSEGKLTEEQKSKILAKIDELQAEREQNRDAFQSKSREEKREAFTQHREELEAWAEENNIPLEYLHFGGRGHGPGHRF